MAFKLLNVMERIRMCFFFFFFVAVFVGTGTGTFTFVVSLGWTSYLLWKMCLMVQKGPEDFHHHHLWVLTSGKLLEFQ